MDNTAFTTAYNEYRNGANVLIRHPLVRNFAFSDGVRDCADAGCHWLIDIFATELPAILKSKGEYMGCVSSVVKDGKAVLTMTGSGDVVLWTRKIDYTDMPQGSWMFYVCDNGDNTFTCILPREY
jgi:hypothetical protein